MVVLGCFFFASRRRHTRSLCDWSSDVCSSDLADFGCPLGHLFLSARKTAGQDKYPRGALDGGNRNRRRSRHGSINEISSFVVHRGIDAWNRGAGEDSFHYIAPRYYYLIARHEISAHQVQRNSGLIEGSVTEFILEQPAQPPGVPHIIGK